MTQPGPSPYTPPRPLGQGDDRLWATLIHLGGIVFTFVPSLVGYLVLKDRSPFVREHSRTALNFQITMSAAHLANIVVGAVLGVLTLGLWLFVEALIATAIGVIVLVFSIIAAVAANRGDGYRYPLSIPFIR